MTFKNLPNHLKPREKGLMIGLSKLSDIELLALFIRLGSDKEDVMSLSTRLVTKFGTLANMEFATIDELRSVRGIGKVKSLEIKGLFEFHKRISNSKLLKLSSDKDIIKILFNQTNDLTMENFIVILLNKDNEVIHTTTLYKGSRTELLVEPKDIISLALKTNSHTIKCFHNHPSGNIEPSAADISLTRRLHFLAKVMNTNFEGNYIFNKDGEIKKIDINKTHND